MDETYFPGSQERVQPGDPIIYGSRWGEALREIHLISGRFITRGHSGFEYEEISEALAVALQELSVIRRKAESALGGTR